jgi:hypothetical protein
MVYFRSDLEFSPSQAALSFADDLGNPSSPWLAGKISWIWIILTVIVGGLIGAARSFEPNYTSRQVYLLIN